jgi:hypothetical protein
MSHKRVYARLRRAMAKSGIFRLNARPATAVSGTVWRRDIAIYGLWLEAGADIASLIRATLNSISRFGGAVSTPLGWTMARTLAVDYRQGVTRHDLDQCRQTRAYAS